MHHWSETTSKQTWIENGLHLSQHKHRRRWRNKTMFFNENINNSTGVRFVGLMNNESDSEYIMHAHWATPRLLWRREKCKLMWLTCGWAYEIYPTTKPLKFAERVFYRRKQHGRIFHELYKIRKLKLWTRPIILSNHKRVKREQSKLRKHIYPATGT